MALWKTVGTETLDLFEDLVDEAGGVAFALHAFAYARAMLFHVAAAPPCGHRATQVVGFVLAVIGSMHQQFHHLLLKQRHAQRGLEDVFNRRRRVVHFFAALPPAQIGVHHVALDRPGAHDRHFDDQVVERRRLEPWQHRHLRTRLDLEHADGVGALDHLVGWRVTAWQRGNAVIAPTVAAHQIQRLADAGEHAQRQAIDLEQLHGFQIVLVPLDDGAVGHRGIFHRHQQRQGLVGDDEAADMLRQMPWVIAQMLCNGQDLVDQRVGQIEPGFFDALVHRRFAIAPTVAIGQQRDLVRWQAEGLGHVAHRALAAIADHRRRQRCAFAPVLAVDVLQHLLAAFVLEVHVDVRRLVAFSDRKRAINRRVSSGLTAVMPNA